MKWPEIFHKCFLQSYKQKVHLATQKKCFFTYVFFYFKKVKMQLKHKRGYAVYGEDPVID